MAGLLELIYHYHDYCVTFGTQQIGHELNCNVASTLSAKAVSESGRCRTGVVVNLSFNSLKAQLTYLFPRSELGFPFRRAVSGMVTVMKLQMNLQ